FPKVDRLVRWTTAKDYLTQYLDKASGDLDAEGKQRASSPKKPLPEIAMKARITIAAPTAPITKPRVPSEPAERCWGFFFLFSSCMTELQMTLPNAIGKITCN
ncbi:MAG: hypothetical protein RLO21_01750, partial [Nitratireductor sp.]